MARFDVFATAGQAGSGYVLDVQADLLRELGTRVVVPLLPPSSAPQAAHGLNPSFEIDGQAHLVLTQFIAAVSDKELRRAVASLEAHSDDITRALDILLTGF